MTESQKLVFREVEGTFKGSEKKKRNVNVSEVNVISENRSDKKIT